MPDTNAVRRAAALIGVALLSFSLAACSGGSSEDVAFSTVEKPTAAKDQDRDEAVDASAAEDKSAAEGAQDNEEPSAPRKDTSADNSSSRGSDDNSGYITLVGLGEAGISASYPACDGRYILIIDSIIDDPAQGDTYNRLARAALLGEPFGKEFTVPGQCDSLRKERYGHVIYPVYIDYGKDQAAACAAKARWGGNVRPLINGDFGDGDGVEVDNARMALDPC